MPRSSRPPTAKLRSLTLGVVLGLLTGAGTIALAGASGGGIANSFVPITPCRLMDTRPGSTVGPRNTPLGAGETYTAQVTGSNGQCTIPADATAIVINVTGVSPTAKTFVTLFPADAAQPTASNLNFVAGQAPTPNLVTVSLSATGAVKVFNSAGSLHVIGDIAGFYQPVVPGPQGPAGNPNRTSAQQIALLQWGDLQFATGTDPYDIAYDGTSMWITNRGANTVSKMDPLTGERVDYATGSNPHGIAYDGTYIWVANHDSDTLSRFVPATGARTDFVSGDGPEALAWDGITLWVTNHAANTVWSMDTGSGLAAEFVTGSGPSGIASSGNVIWVANTAANTVSRIDPFSGTRVDIPVGTSPFGVVFDGTYVWVTNQGSNTISRIDTGSLDVMPFATGPGPRGIAITGTSLWVSNAGRDTLTSYDAAGDRSDRESGPGVGEVAYDGRSLWVLLTGSDKVLRMVLP